MKRGELSTEVQEKAKELFGREITLRELRLIPYFHFCMTNERRINSARVNNEELKIIAQWASEGYILDGVTEKGRLMLSAGVHLKITKEFWNILNEMLWLSFVIYDDVCDE